MYEKLKSLAKVAANTVIGGKIFADEDVFYARLSICKGCALMQTTAGRDRCSICTCPIEAKCLAHGSECPKKKW